MTQTLNRELLAKVRDWIAGGREVVVFDAKAGFNMTYVLQETGRGDCGSTCCIAGAGFALSDRYSDDELRLFADRSSWFDEAVKLFGMTEEQADELFTPGDVVDMDYCDDRHDRIALWGGRFGYSDITNDWAVAVIDHFLATGEINWSVGRPEGV